MKRSKSSNYLSVRVPKPDDDELPVNVYQGYLEIRDEIKVLREQIQSLEAEIRNVQAESSRWTLRYSRRILLVSNMLLGLYIFSDRLIDLFRELVKENITFRSMFSRFTNRRRKNDADFSVAHKTRMQRVFYKGLLNALLRSASFFFSAYWLMKHKRWKRNTGLFISIVGTAVLLITGRASPWTLYFNGFALMLYFTARFYNYMPHIVPVPRPPHLSHHHHHHHQNHQNHHYRRSTSLRNNHKSSSKSYSHSRSHSYPSLSLSSSLSSSPSPLPTPPPPAPSSSSLSSSSSSPPPSRSLSSFDDTSKTSSSYNDNHH